MGTVYKAYDPLLARVVAVKVISGQFSTQPDLRERFFREARAVARLDHPNIVTVYDLGEEDGLPYLAMQFLEGQDLEHRMRGLGIDVPVEVMQSNGGLASVAVAAQLPVRLLESGPAGGIAGIAHFAEQLGLDHVITVDIGGTSTDVSVILDRRPTFTTSSAAMTAS